MSYRGRFSYAERQYYGDATQIKLNQLLTELPQDAATILNTTLTWFKDAHSRYIKTYNGLLQEQREDMELRAIKLDLPKEINTRLNQVFDFLELIRREAKIQGDSEYLQKIDFAIQSVTQDTLRSQLKSQEDIYHFVQHLHQELPKQKELHRKVGKTELTQVVQQMHQLLHGANVKINKEQAETLEARRALWKTAARWDRMYRILKHSAQAVLHHQQREAEHPDFFLDLGLPTSPPASTTPPSEPVASTT